MRKHHSGISTGRTRTRQREAAAQRDKLLTVRQIEVLRLLAEGNKMREVGVMLGVKARTIAFHKYRIMDVLGIRRNAELVLYAVKNRIIAS